jgi:hypothetical protein
MIVALIVTVAGVLGLSVYTLVLGGGPGGSDSDGMHFRCESCKAEFVRPTEDLTLREKNTLPAYLRIDCPQCEAKRCCIPMVKCPKCGKYFVPESYRNPAGKRAGTVKDVCPYCQTDRDEWYRQYYSKNR